MIPEVEIVYSDIYDAVLSKSKRIRYNRKRLIEGERFTKKLQKAWNKCSNQILFQMSKLTGLKWQKNYMECFVTFNTPYPFSHPLTIYVSKKIEPAIMSIVHELSHILLWGNREKVKWPESNTGIYKKYKNENYNTKLHFSIHALVVLVINKVFGKNGGKYLQWETWWKREPEHPMAKEYKHSWEIVQKEGPENVIKETIK